MQRINVLYGHTRHLLRQSVLDYGALVCIMRARATPYWGIVSECSAPALPGLLSAIQATRTRVSCLTIPAPVLNGLLCVIGATPTAFVAPQRGEIDVSHHHIISSSSLHHGDQERQATAAHCYMQCVADGGVVPTVTCSAQGRLSVCRPQPGGPYMGPPSANVLAAATPPLPTGGELLTGVGLNGRALHGLALTGPTPRLHGVAYRRHPSQPTAGSPGAPARAHAAEGQREGLRSAGRERRPAGE